MDNYDLQAQAEKLLAHMKLGPPREPGQRLRPTDTLKILDLADRGELTQEQIAAEVGCDQSTVSRTIEAFQDTRELAKRYMNASAFPAAGQLLDIIINGKPKEAVQAVKLLFSANGVIDRGQPANVAIQVNVGQLGQPAAHDPLGGKDIVITATPVTPAPRDSRNH